MVRRPSALMIAAVGVAALGMMTGIGLLPLPTHWLNAGESPSVALLMLGSGMVAMAEWGQLRLRLGSSLVGLTWAEGGFVMVATIVPAGWVPAAVLVGAWGGHTVLAALDHRRTMSMILRATATLTLASAAGMLASGLVVLPHGQPLTITTAFGLAVGAAVFAVVTSALTAAWVGDSIGWPTKVVFVRIIDGKLPLAAGGTTVGLVFAIAVDAGRYWLVLLLPLLVTLLHQAYGYHLRAEDERWTWQLFSDVTGALNRLDERDAAIAGARGALRLFPAIAAEVVVGGAEGEPTRTYAAERDHGEALLADYPGFRWRREPPVRIRPLVVDGARIGDLRLRLARPVPFKRRDRHILAAYGDALAAALHDAETHRRLRVITERSDYDAAHDPVTGVGNRSALLTRGSAILSRMPETRRVALLLLDINRFKEVNNTLGHAAGDELLYAVALRLRTAMGPGELLARLGGDEFAVLIGDDGGDTDERALRRAQELVDRIASPVEVAGIALSVEASIGVVLARAGDVDMTELLRRADIAMYQAKREAKSIVSYTAIDGEASVDRLALLAEVRAALAVQDQFTVVMQPAIALDTGRPMGCEALVRWDHPRRGRLGPADFLSAVEDSELVGAFTRYVLERSLAIAGNWASRGIDQSVAVNVFARSLLDPTLARELPAMLARHGVRADRLTLEITESVVLMEMAVVEEVLADLRAAGVRISVDDFGSGVSSLTFLARVPVDEVKIDREFISGIVDSAEAAAVVRTTVDLGRQLGLRVVAEGVETARQRNTLRELGCEFAQGYHFCRPLPPAQIEDLLMEANSSPNR